MAAICFLGPKVNRDARKLCGHNYNLPSERKLKCNPWPGRSNNPHNEQLLLSLYTVMKLTCMPTKIALLFIQLHAEDDCGGGSEELANMLGSGKSWRCSLDHSYLIRQQGNWHGIGSDNSSRVGNAYTCVSISAPLFPAVL